MDVKTFISSEKARKAVNLKSYCTSAVGMPTLTDIMSELEKPGRDPRGTAKVFSFSPAIRTIEDVKPGMVLDGVVTNITNFGCFVNLGIKTKGLVHVSQMSDKFVKNPSEIVSIQQRVTVKVQDVDLKRERISLSMKGVEQQL